MVQKIFVFFILWCGFKVGYAGNGMTEMTKLTLFSPSREVVVDIEQVDGKMNYWVTCKKIRVLLPSRLSWEVDGRRLGDRVKVVDMEKGGTHHTFYPVVGNRAWAENRYKSYFLNVSDSDGTKYQVEFRVYNQGVAFRYLTETDRQVQVDDYTTFNFPEEGVCWLQSNARFYEAGYESFKLNRLPVGVTAGPPVTVSYPGGLYTSVTEGGLSNFGGMGLKVIAPAGFQAALEGNTYLSGHIATPWRVIMIGDLNSLVNNEIVSDVSEPLSPVFRKNTEWIKPGNCVWSWLAGYGVSLENMKRFTDWAAELGIPYNLVDEGWSHWQDKQKGRDAWQMVADLVEYSEKKGVKIFLWKAYPDRKGIEGIQTPERRRAFFRKCRDLGIAGLKIDFFDQESQVITRYYAETLRDAAEFGLMINFHGSNKPTGLNRTYPNEVSREAIKGLEYGCSDARQDVITPYTRFLAGHADYTPMAFGENWMGNTTEAHQIAMTAVFLSPLRCYGGRPEDYVTHPARDIFLSIPTIWDETVVLPPSEIGDCVVMAHRSGKDWFVAALTEQERRDMVLPLDFLGKGHYKATVVEDGEDRKCAISCRNCSSKDRLNIRMKAGGGYLARLQRVK